MDQKQADLLEMTRLISDYERQIERIHLEVSQKDRKEAIYSKSLEQLSEQKASLKTELAQKEVDLEQLEEDLKQKKQEIKNVETELSRFATDPDHIIEKFTRRFC